MESRREFIKYKVLGSILGVTGLPLLHLQENLLAQNSITQNSARFINEGNINWKAVRKEFLLSRDRVHFNTASIGPSPKSVVKAIFDKLEELEIKANDGRSYTPEVHEVLGKFFNVNSKDIGITRNATEGINIVARSLPLKEGDEVIITSDEHIGGSAPWLALEKEKGIKVKIIDLNLEGVDNLKKIKNSITKNTKVVSVSHITCTTGLRLPVKEIVELCRNNNIYSCIDGAQAVGMIPVDLQDINPDFYAASGHKWLFGPKGTGILYINESVILATSPVFVGAYSDENFNLATKTLDFRQTAQRVEYGTRNTPIVIGLGSAVEFMSGLGISKIEARGRELINYFRSNLSILSGVEVLTPENPEYSSSILTIRFKGKDNFPIMDKVDKIMTIKTRNVYENNLNAIRISFSLLNNYKEIDALLTSLDKYSKEIP